VATYTTTVKNLIDNNYDLGLKNYPIFDEAYRNVLNNKIIEHYRFREIGMETPALFKFFLNRELNEIMPLYNQYYDSAKLQFNPLQNVSMTEEFHNDGTETGTQTLSKSDHITNDTTNNVSGTNNQTTTISRDGTEKKTESLSETASSNGNIVNDATDNTLEDLNQNVSSNTTTDLTNKSTSKEDLNKTSSNTQVLDNTTTDTKTGTDTDTKTGINWDKYSDTPQGSIVNLDGDDYLSNARKLQVDETLQKGFNNTNTHGVDETTTNNGSIHDVNTTDNSSTQTGNSQNDTTSNGDNAINKTSHQESNTTNESQTANENDINVVTTNTGSDIIEGNNTEETISANVISGTGSATTNKTNTTVDDYIKNLTGYNGNLSQSKLLTEFRETFLNIDMMIINSLSDLFLNLW
jgi:hypothetical protein